MLVSSFKARSDADSLVKDITKRLPQSAPWILKVDLGKKGVRYRVLVGQYKTSSESKEAAKSLKSLKLKPLSRKWTRWVK